MLHSFKGAKNLFSLFDEAQQQQLISSAKTINLVSGQMLFNKNDLASHFYLVKKGQIKLFRITPAGDEKVFHLFSPGGWIAEMAMFMPQPIYPMNAQAEIATQLLKVKREALHQIIENSPTLAASLLGFMSTKIVSLVNNIDKLTFINASQRVVLHLGHLYQMQGSVDNRVRLPAPKRVLASQLNITPETFSRIFRKFKSQGFIVERGDCIELHDIETMCSEVELTPEIF